MAAQTGGCAVCCALGSSRTNGPLVRGPPANTHARPPTANRKARGRRTQGMEGDIRRQGGCGHKPNGAIPHHMACSRCTVLPEPGMPASHNTATWLSPLQPASETARLFSLYLVPTNTDHDVAVRTRNWMHMVRLVLSLDCGTTALISLGTTTLDRTCVQQAMYLYLQLTRIQIALSLHVGWAVVDNRGQVGDSKAAGMGMSKETQLTNGNRTNEQKTNKNSKLKVHVVNTTDQNSNKRGSSSSKSNGNLDENEPHTSPPRLTLPCKIWRSPAQAG